MDSPPLATVSWRHTLRRGLIPTLVLAPLVAGVAWLCVDAFVFEIGTPLQLNYVEGFNVDDAGRLAAGRALYGDPSHAPFVVSIYTPGYPAAVAALMTAGVNGLVAARLVQFLCVLGIAVLIAASGYARTRWIAFAAGLYFLLDPIQPFWQVVARPDAAATLLAIVGIVTLERKGRTGSGDALAAVLFAASILTKQSFVAAPAAALIVLRRSGWARVLRFASLLAVFCVVPAAALQVLTHGEFLRHIVIGNINPFSWAAVARLGGWFWSRHLVELAVMLAILLVRTQGQPWSLTGLWAAIASVLATIAVGKLGADLNYFIEPVAAIALLAARQLPSLWKPLPTAWARAVVAVLVLSGLAATVNGFVETLAWHRPLTAAEAPYRELVALVAATPGVVVSDDACLLVQAHRSVHIQPFVMTQLAEAGRWDQRPFLAELERQRVKLIIAQVSPEWVFKTRYTAEMRKLIAERYVPAGRYVLGAAYTVFVPAARRQHRP